jgi:kynurenine formamidase
VTRIIDLSMPIEDDFRWPVERRVRGLGTAHRQTARSRGIRPAAAGVAFDFPQDWCIRLVLEGERRPLAENVTHDVLLRDGVILIAYLSNAVALTGPRTFLCCLPLKVVAADGAPARVVALEQH